MGQLFRPDGGIVEVAPPKAAAERRQRGLSGCTGRPDSAACREKRRSFVIAVWWCLVCCLAPITLSSSGTEVYLFWKTVSNSSTSWTNSLGGAPGALGPLPAAREGLGPESHLSPASKGPDWPRISSKGKFSVPNHQGIHCYLGVGTQGAGSQRPKEKWDRFLRPGVGRPVTKKDLFR